MKFITALGHALHGAKITADGWRIDRCFFEVDKVTKQIVYFNGEEYESVDARYLFLWMNQSEWELLA